MTTNEEVNRLVEKLSPLPAGVDKWIYSDVVENAYIIFDNRQGKAVCTRCGKEFPTKKLTNVKHNEKTHCPKCGAAAEYKAGHYGRKKLTEYFRILVFTRRGKSVYGTLHEITVGFEPFGRPILHKWLAAMYVFKENKQIYYKHHKSWSFGNEYWTESYDVRMPTPPRGHYYYPAKFEYTELYTDNLESVFTKSCLKYHYDAEFFTNHEIGPREMINYINQSLKYPAIELLRKAGYTNLVLNRIRGNSGCLGATNIKGKNLESILKLPRRWRKKVKSLDMTHAELRVFQQLSEEFKAIADHEFLRQYMCSEWYRRDVERFVSMEKAVQYIKTQGHSISLYKDYLVAAHSIGEDMSSKVILFPKNFMQEHDRVTSLQKVQEDEQSRRAMAEVVEKIKRQFPLYQQGSFLIRVAESQNELNEESKALSHCVRTYGEKVAKGKTMIFFIRRIDEPDIPFYTLELNNKREMVQCRGNRNCNMTEEVKTFVDGWLEYINKKSKKKKEAA